MRNIYLQVCGKIGAICQENDIVFELYVLILFAFLCCMLTTDDHSWDAALAAKLLVKLLCCESKTYKRHNNSCFYFHSLLTKNFELLWNPDITITDIYFMDRSELKFSFCSVTGEYDCGSRILCIREPLGTQSPKLFPGTFLPENLENLQPTPL